MKSDPDHLEGFPDGIWVSGRSILVVGDTV